MDRLLELVQAGLVSSGAALYAPWVLGLLYFGDKLLAYFTGRETRAAEQRKTDRASAEGAMEDFVKNLRDDIERVKKERDEYAKENVALRDDNRAKQVEIDRTWAKVHAFDRFAHWQYHLINNLRMVDYGYGLRKRPQAKIALPAVPKTDQVQSWNPPDDPPWKAALDAEPIEGEVKND